jgi:hypothetical protein
LLIELAIEIALAATVWLLLFVFSPPLQILLGQVLKPDPDAPVGFFSDRWRDSDTARPRIA